MKRVHKLPAGSHNGGESRFQHRQVGARQDGRDDGVAIVRRIGVGRRAADDGRVGQRADSGRPQQRAEQQRSAAARRQRAERVRANPRQIGRAAVGRELGVLQRDGQTVDKRGLQRVGGAEVLNGNGIAEQLAGLRDSRGGGLDHGEVGRSLDGRFNRVGIVLRVGVGRIAGNGDGVGQRARKRRVYPPADRQQETAARRQRTGGIRAGPRHESAALHGKFGVLQRGGQRVGHDDVLRRIRAGVGDVEQIGQRLSGCRRVGQRRFPHREVGRRSDGGDGRIRIVRGVGVGRIAADRSGIGQHAGGQVDDGAQQQRSQRACGKRAERIGTAPRRKGNSAVGRKLRVR